MLQRDRQDGAGHLQGCHGLDGRGRDAVRGGLHVAAAVEALDDDLREGRGVSD